MENKLYAVKSLVPNVNYTDVMTDPELAMVYRWAKCGDMQYMSLDAIKAMYANYPNYRSWVLPVDTEALIALGIKLDEAERIKAAAEKMNKRRVVIQ